MERLAGRVAVITGGASGIGLGLARRLLAEGMKVVVADVDRPALDAAVAELERKGEAVGRCTDVAEARQVDALAEDAVARFGAVHLLVNNAGVGGFQRFEHTSLASWEWILGVNLWGVIHGCRAFLPILKAQDEAHIVNVSSMAALLHSPFHHPYNVSKAAVVALSEGLHVELMRETPHVGISVLLPGFTATNIAEDERNAPPAHVRRDVTDPDLADIRTAVADGLAAGMTPAEMADHIVRAIRHRQLHIFSHPDWLTAVRERFDNILSGRPVDNPLGSVG